MIRMLRVMVLVALPCVAVMESRAEDPVISHVHTSDGVVVGEANASKEGVSVRIPSENDRVVLIPWFEVRRVDEGWEVPEEYQRIADNAALGHARRMRGDLRGCAEKYQPIAARFLESDSLMSREVFSGLLDEALVRGDFFDASVMLVLLGTNTLDGIDERYDVHTGIPMLRAPAQRHRFDGFATMIVQSSGEHGSYADQGVLVSAFHAIDDPEMSDDGVLEIIDAMDASVRRGGEYRQGMELYAMMLRAQRHPDAEERQAARVWLSSRARLRPGGWYDAWCRCAIGASLLHESYLVSDDDELLSQGIIELIHVMVRYRTQLPELARWAMEASTTALRASGRGVEAGELIKSFDLRDTDHE